MTSWQQPGERAIPKHLQIETINGVCSARCVMCSIEDWTRKVQVMTEEELRIILTKYLPCRDQLEYLTLHGFAEPLLDRKLPEKVRMAKDMGFRGVGFASNCTHLDEDCSRRLLEARLDTIICSIDGARKETHEKIRIKTDFDTVVRNAETFLRLRDEGNYGTRVVIRFVRQQLNRDEWDEYRNYWSARISPERRDEILVFDVHNWGDKIGDYESQDVNAGLSMEGLVCPDIFERMFIFSNGQVAHCCADDSGFFDHGNVLESDPIEIYNNNIFSQYRRRMLEGEILKLKHCENCTIARSRALKPVNL